MLSLFPLFLLFVTATSSCLSLPSLQVEEISKKIWKNECNQSIEGLLSWNPGEEFASLGIGHFIWYPPGKRGPFQETFPAFLQFLQENKVCIPTWLMTAPGCPWHTRKEFLESQHGCQAQELRELLLATISLQGQFIAKRFEYREADLTEGVAPDQKKHIENQLKRLKQAPNGYYILLDYLNFKGDGLDPKERYQGEGWGLMQVLQAMPDNTSDPIKEFKAAAKAILKRRVQNSPPARNEQRWLPGWFNRLDTY